MTSRQNTHPNAGRPVPAPLPPAPAYAPPPYTPAPQRNASYASDTSSTWSDSSSTLNSSPTTPSYSPNGYPTKASDGYPGGPAAQMKRSWTSASEGQTNSMSASNGGGHGAPAARRPTNGIPANSSAPVFAGFNARRMCKR